MASTSEMLRAGLFLLVNTMVIGACLIVGGPLFGALSTFVSNFHYAENTPLPPTLVQWIPGFFFTMLLVLELFLVIRLAYVVISKTDYQGGTEF
jgi:hypothetical protein